MAKVLRGVGKFDCEIEKGGPKAKPASSTHGILVVNECVGTVDTGTAVHVYLCTCTTGSTVPGSKKVEDTHPHLVLTGNYVHVTSVVWS